MACACFPGVTGDISACLQSVNRQDEACVLTIEGLTDSRALLGSIKAARPAHLLFDLYIDALEALLRKAKDGIDASSLL